jgi:hypothetical protein
MTPALTAIRSRSLLESALVPVLPSAGSGADALAIEQRLRNMRTLLTGGASALKDVRGRSAKALPIEEQLRKKLASFKEMTATIAMHLDPEWRTKLFAQLDRLLDPEDWDEGFQVPSEQSFSTFLRMIIYLHPTRRPGIGLSPHGHFLAAWTRGNDRIVIECIANDEVRWVLSRDLDGDRETGAGTVQLHRIPDVTAAYEPEALFNDGHKLLA